MDDLIARIRAAIDEDEGLALAAVNWSYGVRQWADDGEPDWAHIVRHDPARVLAMVAAHRAILAEHAESDDGSCLGCGANYCEEPRVPDINDCVTLLALAKGYGIEP